MTLAEPTASVWSENEAKSLTLKPVKRIEDLYSNTAISMRRLPFLEIICDRFVHKFSSSFRLLAGDFAVVSVEQITSEHLDEVLPSLPSTSLTGIFRHSTRGGMGMVCLDQSLVYLFVNMLLGGRRVAAQVGDARSYTSIERNLIERVIKAILEDLSHVFEGDGPKTFLFERLEMNSRFALIDKSSASVFHIKIKIELEDRSGFFDVVIPFGTIEHVFSEAAPFQATEQDPLWQKTLAGELGQTNFSLDVVLDEPHCQLNDVMEWQKGSQIFLLKSPESLVSIVCEGKLMFKAKVGHSGPCIAVSIEEVLP